MRTSLVVASIAIASTLVHCSSDGTSGGGGDAGHADGGADSAADSAGGDAGPVVNGCGASDFAANEQSMPTASRAITFPMGASPAQYSPHCMKIKVGQSVTWTGSFASHPLEPIGGDTGNPITLTSSGTTVTVAFPAAGTFGFDCANHPSTMFGAIQVVP